MEQISQSPSVHRLNRDVVSNGTGCKKQKKKKNRPRRQRRTDSNLPMIYCKEMQRRREWERQEVSIYLGKEVPPVNPSHPSARLPREGSCD